jgi:hypothetical protein
MGFNLAKTPPDSIGLCVDIDHRQGWKVPGICPNLKEQG